MTFSIYIYSDGSPIARLFKEQIQYLTLIMPPSNRKRPISNESFIDAYAHIFNVCTNLLYFDFNRWNVNDNSRLSLCNRISTTCYSSTLVFLSANVSTFDDCLCLFDGRLNQLSQLIINIRSINTSAFTIDNTVSNFF